MELIAFLLCKDAVRARSKKPLNAACFCRPGLLYSRRSMTEPRSRRITLRVCAVAVLLLCVAVAAAHHRLLERWHLLRLEQDLTAGWLDHVVALERYGSDASVEPLLERVGVGREHQKAVLRSLASVYRRCSSLRRERIGDGLFDFIESDRPGGAAAAATLHSVQPRSPVILARTARRLTSKSDLARRLAAVLLVDAWPASRGAVDEFLTRWREDDSPVTDAHVVSFFRVAHEHPSAEIPGAPTDPDEFLSVANQELGRRLCRVQSLEHPEAHVRGIALSFAILGGTVPPTFDVELLRRCFTEDRDPLVRRVALRLAGFAGPQRQSVDLMNTILRADVTPEILVEAILARNVWSHGLGLGLLGVPRRMELWDGLVADWLVPEQFTASLWDSVRWSPQELRALRRQLRSSSDSAVRDAASLVLAGRDPPPPEEGYRVHEWGVWLDAGGAITPIETVTADLPEFVHRANIGAQEYWEHRSYRDPAPALKPVLFFYATKPIVLDVEAYFYEGKPWCFFPEATNYIHTVRGTQSHHRRPLLRQFDDRGPGEGDADWPRRQRRATSPPWLRALPGADFLPSKENVPSLRVPALSSELRRRYRVAPWLVPNHTPESRGGGLDIVALESIGLEWKGLRVGFDASLEPRAPAVPAGSFWHHLRAVPATSVSVRGDTESFLFYDGATKLPNPVALCWKTPARERLVLTGLPFDHYPELDWARTRRRTDEKSRRTAVPFVLVVRKRAGEEPRGQFLFDVSSNEPSFELALEDLPLIGNTLTARFRDLLVRRGLSAAEAESLVRTWAAEFFETEGVRVITGLPRWLYDAMIPLALRPAPSEFVRVGLVWRDGDSIPVGLSGLGSENPERRWRPKSVEVKRRPLAIRRRALPELVWTPASESHVDGVLRPVVSGKAASLAAAGRFAAVRSVLPPRRGHGQELDGDHVLLVDWESKRTAVFEAKRHGGCESIWMVDLSSDGQRMLFIDFEADQPIRIADFAAGEILWLDAAGVFAPRLSADGTCVAFATRHPNDSGIGLIDLSSPEAWKHFTARFANAPSISADGRRVVFLADRNPKPGEAGEPDVFLLDVDSETLLDVSRFRGAEFLTDVSADGTRILGASQREGVSDLYVTDVNERRFHPIRRTDDECCGPRALAGNGQRVAFALGDEIFVRDLATGTVIRVPDADGATRLYLSHDGSRLLVTRPGSRELSTFLLDVPRFPETSPASESSKMKSDE